MQSTIQFRLFIVLLGACTFLICRGLKVQNQEVSGSHPMPGAVATSHAQATIIPGK
jgi:hypothetical protein